MKKRKAQRTRLVSNANIDLETTNLIDEHEKTKELALLNLIAQIIVEAILRDLYADKKVL